MRIDHLKYIAFGLAAVIIAVLIVATVVEKFQGTSYAYENIYNSTWMVALWIIMAHFASFYIMRKRIYKQPITFMLHLSFIVILFGAFITHKCGFQGQIHLREGERTSLFMLEDGNERSLPFTLKLRKFELQFYKGTFAPMDYVSHIELFDGNELIESKASMNNIIKYRNYRFYQSGYDKDGKGTTLTISHDPWGIGITYAGYLMLLISVVRFFFEPKSHFRKLLQHPALKRGATMIIAIMATLSVEQAYAGKPLPSVLPHDVAAKFGEMAIYYNDRICPLQTLAKDFTSKLYGKPTYRGLSAEQVLTGWFFFYDDWKNEPMIKIKGSDVQRILGIDNKYARLSDFASFEGYKLDSVLRGDNMTTRRNAEAANEKFNLTSMLCTGSLLKIYPYRDSTDVVTWYSLADKLPAEVPYEQWLFIGRSMNLVAEHIMRKDYDKVVSFIEKIELYQKKEAGNLMPSQWRLNSELLYNNINVNRPLAMTCMMLGIILFLVYCTCSSLRIRKSKWLDITLVAGLITIVVYISTQITLRWIISEHVPLSNGFETMQFMALCSALISLFASRKFSMSLPFGYLLCGFTLLVSMMGEASPRITQLMPVLQSPLLSIHVVVIMVAYSLLAFIMLNGITAIILRYTKRDYESDVEYLQVISHILLYPAIFLLAIGIFVGAIWANISWGRYWGWDPKEVWALITMLIYSAALHSQSLGKFRQPMFFHTFMIMAFLSVLITYFGVNFILGGMHSYA